MCKGGWASMHAIAKCPWRRMYIKEVFSALEEREGSLWRQDFVGKAWGAEGEPQGGCGGSPTAGGALSTGQDPSPRSKEL